MANLVLCIFYHNKEKKEVLFQGRHPSDEILFSLPVLFQAQKARRTPFMHHGLGAPLWAVPGITGEPAQPQCCTPRVGVGRRQRPCRGSRVGAAPGARGGGRARRHIPAHLKLAAGRETQARLGKWLFLLVGKGTEFSAPRASVHGPPPLIPLLAGFIRGTCLALNT